MEELIEGSDGYDIEQQRIEERILSIIAKIKKDRNRACMQNIHTSINRNDINIDMEK